MRTGFWLGGGIGSLINVLDPEVVVVGGGAVEGLYPVDRGFTMSVARALTSSWTSAVERAKGVEVRRMVEDQRAALDLALDLATASAPLSEAAVREVHAVVCSSQATHRVQASVGPQDQPLPKGTYKTGPNHVLEPDGTWHPYAPVEDVGHEMHRLLGATRSAAYGDAHPVVQAAYLHHGLTSIHPFADGNGRVARVLASVPLLRAVSLPLVLYADEKPDYLDALAAADHGGTGVLVTWFENQMLDAIEDLVEALLPEADIGSAAARVDQGLKSGGQRLSLSGLRALDQLERDIVQLLLAAAPGGVEALAIRSSASSSAARQAVVHERGTLSIQLRAERDELAWKVEHQCGLRWVDDGTDEAVLLVDATFPVDARLPVPPPLRLRHSVLAQGLDQRLRDRLRRWAEREAEALLAGLAIVMRADGG